MGRRQEDIERLLRGYMERIDAMEDAVHLIRETLKERLPGFEEGYSTHETAFRQSKPLVPGPGSVAQALDRLAHQVSELLADGSQP